MSAREGARQTFAFRPESDSLQGKQTYTESGAKVSEMSR